MSGEIDLERLDLASGDGPAIVLMRVEDFSHIQAEFLQRVQDCLNEVRPNTLLWAIHTDQSIQAFSEEYSLMILRQVAANISDEDLAKIGLARMESKQ